MNMKTKIAREGIHSFYDHLLPIVDALIEGGNEPFHPQKFIPSQGGTYCPMKKRIDFDLIRARFELPDNIKLDDDQNSIFDTLSYLEILGGEG